jgi:transposase
MLDLQQILNTGNLLIKVLVKIQNTIFKNLSDDIDYARAVLEPYYIKLCKSLSTENGYNLSLGGEGNPRYLLPEKGLLYNLYVRDKLSIIKMAQKFQVSKFTITTWLKKYEIPIRVSQECQTTLPRPTKSSLQKLYLKQKVPVIHIAAKFDVSVRTVYRWLKYYQFPIRPSGRIPKS